MASVNFDHSTNLLNTANVEESNQSQKSKLKKRQGSTIVQQKAKMFDQQPNGGVISSSPTLNSRLRSQSLRSLKDLKVNQTVQDKLPESSKKSSPQPANLTISSFDSPQIQRPPQKPLPPRPLPKEKASSEKTESLNNSKESVETFVKFEVSPEKNLDASLEIKARNNIVNEILETEIAFNGQICDLLSIGALFNDDPEPVMRKLIKKVKGLDDTFKTRLKNYFNDFQAIKQFSDRLIINLKSYSDIKSFSHPFLGDNLLVFKTLAVNHGRFLSLDAQTKKSLTKILDETYKDILKPCSNVTRTFEMIAIVPIQRVPRYQLLIKNLLDVTSNEEDKTILIEAFNKISSINTVMNNYVKGYEKISQLIDGLDNVPLIVKDPGLNNNDV